MISASLLILGTCTLLLNYTHSLWYFILIYSIVMSIATGGASMVTIHGLLARWFWRKRGLALSLGTAGGSAGSFLLVPFANYLILASGWRITWVALGGMILLLALPLAFILIKDDPSDVGEAPDTLGIALPTLQPARAVEKGLSAAAQAPRDVATPPGRAVSRGRSGGLC